MPLPAPLLPPIAPEAPADARCSKHPEERATGTCQRCGAFVCRQDFKLLDLKVFCTECAVRPEVDYLEAYRLQYWGKRDAWAWLFGLGGVLNVLTGLALAAALLVKGEPAAASELVVAAVVVAVGINSLCFWAGLAFARVGLFAGIAALGIANVATMGAAGVGSVIFPLLIALSVVNGTRNKLFFKLEVSRADLKKAWDTFHNNTIARNATTLGVAGLLIPVFAPAAIICGVIGLKRVNPHAFPPIGNRGRAIGGIALGAVGTVLWIGLGVLMFLGR
jgi:hypothetical protein